MLGLERDRDSRRRELSVKITRRDLLKVLGSAGAGFGLGSLLDKEALAKPGQIRIDPKSFAETASFVVFEEGGAYHVKDGRTGQIVFSDVDAASVIQKAIDALPPAGGKIFIKRGEYLMNAIPRLKGKSNVVIEGDYPVLKANVPAGISLLIGEHLATTKLGENVIVRGIIFDGNYPTIPNAARLTSSK